MTTESKTRINLENHTRKGLTQWETRIASKCSGITNCCKVWVSGSMRLNMLIMPLRIWKDSKRQCWKGPEEYVDLTTMLDTRCRLAAMPSNHGQGKASWEDEFVSKNDARAAQGLCCGKGATTSTVERELIIQSADFSFIALVVSNQLFQAPLHPYYSETTRRKPVVDVYWLADTGGVHCSSIAHLHTIWSKWNGNCSLQCFSTVRKALAVQTTAQVMRMIQKFGIPVSSVEPFDMYLKPSRESFRAISQFGFRRCD